MNLKQSKKIPLIPYKDLASCNITLVSYFWGILYYVRYITKFRPQRTIGEAKTINNQLNSNPLVQHYHLSHKVILISHNQKT